MPQSVTDRPTVATEDWIMLAKSGRYYWDQEAVRRGFADDRMGDPGGYRWQYSEGAARNDVGQFASGWKKGRDLNGRALRTTDPYFDSLDSLIADTRRQLAHLERIRERGGLLLDDDGLPLALDVTSQGSDLAHYASFPEGVVTPWILGATSEMGCCAACGSPYVRMVSEARGDMVGKGSWFDHSLDESNGRVRSGTVTHTGNRKTSYEPGQTLGWAKSCDCPTDARQPSVILDCFLGSGTTAVAARRLGRRVVGIDASQFYVDMAVRRLEGITPTLPTPSPRPPPATQLALGEGR